MKVHKTYLLVSFSYYGTPASSLDIYVKYILWIQEEKQPLTEKTEFASEVFALNLRES